MAIEGINKHLQMILAQENYSHLQEQTNSDNKMNVRELLLN